ncbi:MFS transporter [Cellulomonas sp. Y8]|uniref:MFS transporter n=1 Tax=Cellulomonas sp. Y8 TaxID=2591145 RepID=UPI003D734938
MSRVDLPAQETQSPRLAGRDVASLALMGVAIFVANTFETLPVGLLGAISSSLGTTEQGAGLLVSSYSIVVVLGAIPMSSLVARRDARTTLVVLFGVFALSAILMTASASLPMAIAARLVGGAAHAVLYTAVFRVALSVVPAGRHGVAAGAVSGGNAIAQSLGVPAAAALGTATSWQVPVGLLAGAFAVMAVLAVLLVPAGAGAAEPGMTARAALRAVVHLPLLRVGVTIAVLITGQFIAYTYVEPLLRAAGVASSSVSIVLLGYGVASVVGLVAVSRLSDRRPALTLRVIGALVALSLAALWFAQASQTAAVVSVIAWGLTFGAVPVLVQVLALRAAGRDPQVAPSMVNTTFNIGITAGAVAGGQIAAAAGTAALPAVSAAVVLAVVAVSLVPRWLPRDRPV